MADFKGIYQLGTVSITNGTLAGQFGTIAGYPTPNGTILGWPSLLFNSSQFNKMKVMINLSSYAITNTTQACTFALRENVSDVGYVQTGITTSINSAGVYWMDSENYSPSIGTLTNSILVTDTRIGIGREKQVVISTSGLVQTLVAQIYLMPYPD